MKDRGALGTLFRYEIKMLLRDTRMIMIAVVAPLVLFPLIILTMKWVESSEEQRLERTTYRYVVVGTEAGWARQQLDRARTLEDAEQDTTVAPIHFEEATDLPSTEQPVLDSLLREGELHLVVKGMTAEEWRALRAEEREAEEDSAEAGAPDGSDFPSPESDSASLESDSASLESDSASPESDSASPESDSASPESDSATAGSDRDRGDSDQADDGLDIPVVRIEYRASSDFSRRASNRLRERLLEVRGQRRDSVYRSAGLPVEPERVASVELQNTATAEKEGGALLGLALTPFLLLLMLTGGSIVAADAISGEKERGTLETLLTTAATRAEIVSAKQLAVVVVGLAVVLVNVLNLLVYLVLGVFDLPENFAVALNPWDPFLLLALFLPLTVLVSSALLLLSGYSKSYKEYQIYFFPIFIVFLLPSLAATLPGMDLRSAIALVPVAGIGVAVREVMVGEYDWLFLFLAFASTAGAAWGLANLTERTLSTERLISQADLDEADLVGGPALFPRHVLRWFLVMWALFYVVALWLGESLGIRGQLVVNLVGLFFGASLLMIWKYRLPVRQALALRAPHPTVWLAVLIGAPSALIVGVGLAELVNTYLFPVPEQMLEAFSRALTGEPFPLWQTILFLAIMPGFFEEIAFRGVLLHGLSRKLRPVAAVLVVGAVFGLFHVSLFRILPTAYLGVVLAAVTLLTGSIFPAMLWHALNNAIAIVPAELGWIGDDFVPPAWSYAAGLVGLAVTFALLWRFRRPYPGLKTGRNPLEERRRAAEAGPGLPVP